MDHGRKLEVSQEKVLDIMARRTDGTYHIEGEHGLAVRGHLTSCHKCGRKILVEMGLFGVPHHTGVTVTCGECLVLSKRFRKEQPEIAAKLENWLLSNNAI